MVILYVCTLVRLPLSLYYIIPLLPAASVRCQHYCLPTNTPSVLPWVEHSLVDGNTPCFHASTFTSMWLHESGFSMRLQYYTLPLFSNPLDATLIICRASLHSLSASGMFQLLLTCADDGPDGGGDCGCVYFSAVSFFTASEVGAG